MVNPDPPARVRVSPERDILTLDAADGTPRTYSAEFLRVMSPSAEVRGHGQAERKIEGGKRQVKIIEIEMTGSYAIRIGFDDGHNTGIYSWVLFDRFDREGASLWEAYLKDLAFRGLSRD